MRTPLAKIARAACAALLAATILPAAALAAPTADAGTPDGAVKAARPLAKTADPSTAGDWADLFDLQDAAGGPSYSTEESGRLWVDKSVYASAADAEAAGIPNVALDNPDQDFLVGLSTMSAASTVRAEQVDPHDTVFVISLNATLGTFTYDGRAYAEYLADALNAAIGRLMGTPAKNGENRVAVIGYSLDAVVMLPLASYEPDDQGRYVAFSRSLPGGGSGLAAVATARDGSAATANGRFDNYSYPQRGLHAAGDMLEQAAALSSADSPRAPELVFMGTSTPPTANTDIADPPPFSADDPEANGFLGAFPSDLHYTGSGTDTALAELLTMQNETARVNDAYRPSARPWSFAPWDFARRASTPTCWRRPACRRPWSCPQPQAARPWICGRTSRRPARFTPRPPPGARKASLCRFSPRGRAVCASATSSSLIR